MEHTEKGKACECCEVKTAQCGKGAWGNANVYCRSGYSKAGSSCCVWFIGWLFTIGFLQLTFWEGVLALAIWPYYIGVAVATVASVAH